MEKLSVARSELIKITGDLKLALILNQFIFLTKKVKDLTKFIEEEKNNFNDELNKQSHYGWFHKSSEELKEEIDISSSARTFGRRLQRLVALGFIYSRNNPKYLWDKTKQYRINLVHIQNALREIGVDTKELHYFFDDKDAMVVNQVSNEKTHEIKRIQSTSTKPLNVNMTIPTDILSKRTDIMSNRNEHIVGAIPEIKNRKEQEYVCMKGGAPLASIEDNIDVIYEDLYKCAGDVILTDAVDGYPNPFVLNQQVNILNDIHMLLKKDFPYAIDLNIIKIACDIFIVQFEQGKRKNPNFKIHNPVGWFKFCYEKAIKAYKIKLNSDKKIETSRQKFNELDQELRTRKKA